MLQKVYLPEYFYEAQKTMAAPYGSLDPGKNGKEESPTWAMTPAT
jgi:hypothetical protein